jgi:uncharacterized protein
MQATIAQLWTYPIKGCQGHSTSLVHALPTGLLHDRSMMVVAAHGGQFVTQRGFPAMALIRPLIVGDTLTLSAPNMPALSLSMRAHDGSRAVTVWRDTLPAIDMGDAAAQWFSAALKAPLRLVRFDAAQQRVIKTPLASLPQAQHHFSDGYPYLVLSLASLRALNERLLASASPAISVDRFRANIIIDGVDAHTEDYAATMTHASGAVIALHSACTRCSVPTIDQATGQQSPDQQPTLALSTYRYDAAQDGVTFGMNALIKQACELRVGDGLKVSLGF